MEESLSHAVGCSFDGGGGGAQLKKLLSSSRGGALSRKYGIPSNKSFVSNQNGGLQLMQYFYLYFVIWF